MLVRILLNKIVEKSVGKNPNIRWRGKSTRLDDATTCYIIARARLMAKNWCARVGTRLMG
jgi:hypothetical protein